MNMRDIKRLATGAVLSNTDGMIAVTFVPFDGGDFELTPKQTNDGLILVDPNRPVGYGFRIAGDADSLDRVSKALAAVARSLRGTAGDTDTPDTDA